LEDHVGLFFSIFPNSKYFDTLNIAKIIYPFAGYGWKVAAFVNVFLKSLLKMGSLFLLFNRAWGPLNEDEWI
jgi:hypothetical protein